MTAKGPYQPFDDITFRRVEVVLDHDAPCDEPRFDHRRKAMGLGVRFSVPVCECGADMADHGCRWCGDLNVVFTNKLGHHCEACYRDGREGERLHEAGL